MISEEHSLQIFTMQGANGVVHEQQQLITNRVITMSTDFMVYHNYASTVQSGVASHLSSSVFSRERTDYLNGPCIRELQEDPRCTLISDLCDNYIRENNFPGLELNNAPNGDNVTTDPDNETVCVSPVVSDIFSVAESNTSVAESTTSGICEPQILEEIIDLNDEYSRPYNDASIISVSDNEEEGDDSCLVVHENLNREFPDSITIDSDTTQSSKKRSKAIDSESQVSFNNEHEMSMKKGGKKRKANESTEETTVDIRDDDDDDDDDPRSPSGSTTTHSEVFKKCQLLDTRDGKNRRIDHHAKKRKLDINVEEGTTRSSLKKESFYTNEIKVNAKKVPCVLLPPSYAVSFFKPKNSKDNKIELMKFDEKNIFHNDKGSFLLVSNNNLSRDDDVEGEMQICHQSATSKKTFGEFENSSNDNFDFRDIARGESPPQQQQQQNCVVYKPKQQSFNTNDGFVWPQRRSTSINEFHSQLKICNNSSDQFQFVPSIFKYPEDCFDVELDTPLNQLMKNLIIDESKNVVPSEFRVKNFRCRTPIFGVKITNNQSGKSKRSRCIVKNDGSTDRKEKKNKRGRKPKNRKKIVQDAASNEKKSVAKFHNIEEKSILRVVLRRESLIEDRLRAELKKNLEEPVSSFKTPKRKRGAKRRINVFNDEVKRLLEFNQFLHGRMTRSRSRNFKSSVET